MRLSIIILKTIITIPEETSVTKDGKPNDKVLRAILMLGFIFIK